MSSKLFFAFTLLVLIFTRFIDIKWGNGYFFHPDENNMATAVAQFSPQNLNPNFFAYGQFPLYLAYFSLHTLHLPHSFSAAVYALRFWSAVFAVLSVLVLLKTFPNKFFFWLLIFCPGLIQLSHFGTTESILIFVFSVNLYLASRIIETPSRFSYYFLAALSSGIGLASKISALIFTIPIFLAILFSFKKYPNYFRFFILSFFYFSFSVFLSALLSPYNWLKYHDLLSSLTYETSVATGSLKVFYTSQFLHSIPYLFQLQHIFPYVWGLPVFIFSFISLGLILKSFFVDHRLNKFLIVLTLSCLVYFLYFGQVYTKWTRFMSPLFFLGPLLTSLLISRFENRFVRYLLTFIVCLPGIYFLIGNYYQSDIRLAATNWLNSQLPPHAQILSEAGNVVNLPVSGSALNVTNFDFYNLDTNPQLQFELPPAIVASDYILVPSRRVFKNQSIADFPFSQKYYQNLFNGSLGFNKIVQFTPQSDLFLDSENAEETWSVFDHPIIRVYAKAKPLTITEIQKLLSLH